MAPSCWSPLSISPSILEKIILPKPVVVTGLCCLQRPREGQEPWPHEFRRPLSRVDVSKHNALPSSEEDPRSPCAACGLRKAGEPSHMKNRPALHTVLIPKRPDIITRYPFSEWCSPQHIESRGAQKGSNLLSHSFRSVVGAVLIHRGHIYPTMQGMDC